MGTVKDAARLRMKLHAAGPAGRPGLLPPHRGARLPQLDDGRQGKTSWVFTRRVEGLLGPARYRAVVRFHWRDLHGKVIAAAKKISRACRQPDHRPNLKIKSLTHPTKHRYDAVVVNNGITAAAPFELQLARGLQAARPGLDRRPSRRTRSASCRCTGRTASPAPRSPSTADPLGLVDERNELDNVFSEAVRLSQSISGGQ